MSPKGTDTPLDHAYHCARPLKSSWLPNLGGQGATLVRASRGGGGVHGITNIRDKLERGDGILSPKPSGPGGRGLNKICSHDVASNGRGRIDAPRWHSAYRYDIVSTRADRNSQSLLERYGYKTTEYTWGLSLSLSHTSSPRPRE